MSDSVTRTPAVACDRSELKTGIVHFGVGGFHRSHQQVRPRCFLLASTASEKNAFCRSWRHPRRAAIASPARMPLRILSNREIKAFHRFGSPGYASDVPLPDHPSHT